MLLGPDDLQRIYELSVAAGILPAAEPGHLARRNPRGKPEGCEDRAPESSPHRARLVGLCLALFLQAGQAAPTPGELDQDFSPPSISGIVEHIALQPDGRILIGGTFTQVDGRQRQGLARLNSDGSSDASFDPQLILTNSAGETLTALPVVQGQQILVAVNAIRADGSSRGALVRLNPDGSRDSAYQPSAFTAPPGSAYAPSPPNRNHLVIPAVASVSLHADGRVLVGGAFRTVNGADRPLLIRLRGDGSLDETFRPDVDSDLFISSVRTLPDGTALIVAYGSAKSSVRRLKSDGSVDPSFHGPSDLDGFLTTLAPFPDGRVLIGGQFSTTFVNTMVARLMPNGGLDSAFHYGGSFDPGGPYRAEWPDIVHALAVQPDGKILLGGRFSFLAVSARSFRKAMARALIDGQDDLGFFPSPSVTGGPSLSVAPNPGSLDGTSVFALALQPDGKILLGGNFAYVNGVARSRMARLIGGDPPPGGPLIVAHPRGGSVEIGSRAALKVVADGEALRYQWRFKGNDTPGETNPTLLIPYVTPAHAGPYAVVVSDASGSTVSWDATLSVWGSRPFIQEHPRSLTADVGELAGFGVAVTASAPSFQWRKDGTNLAGRIYQILQLHSVTDADAGQYSVVVSNLLGFAVSSNATLTVRAPSLPVIIEQPAGTDSAPGTTVRLAVSAIGTRPLSFQWLMDGRPVSRDDTFVPYELGGYSGQPVYSTLSLLRTTSGHSGLYSVIVSNRLGAVTSAQARVTIGFLPPLFIVQPASQEIDSGETVEFLGITSDASAGRLTETYQWRKDGANLVGANGTRLTLTDVTPESAGIYQLVAANEGGTTVSFPARLTVFPPVTLAEALNEDSSRTDLIWRTGGSEPWKGQFSVALDKTAARSGRFAAGEGAVESWLETSVVGPGTVSFWWKVANRSSVDLLRDGKPSAGLQFSLNERVIAHIASPNTVQSYVTSVEEVAGWQRKTFEVAAGAQTMRWRFFRSSSGPVTEYAWLDRVRFLPDGFISLESERFFENKRVRVLLIGGTNRAYILQASSNLTDWVPVSEALPTNSVFAFPDLPIPENGQRFYRAVLRP